MGGACTKGADAAPTELLGKRKYIIEVGAVTMQFDERKASLPGVLVVFSDTVPSAGLSFAFKEARSGTLHVKDFDESELAREKESAGISHGWAPFFKSIAADVTKGKAQLNHAAGVIHLGFTIVSSKETASAQPFTVTLKPRQNAVSKDLIHYVLGPLSRMVQARRETAAELEKEARYIKNECDLIVKDASQRKHLETIEKLTPLMTQLRLDAARDGKASAALHAQVTQLERRLRKLRRPKDVKHPLDGMYEDGGARAFQHLPQAEEHEPMAKVHSEELCDFIRKNFPNRHDHMLVDHLTSIVKAPSTPEIQQLKAALGEDLDVTLFSRLDFWDYDVFKVEKMTRGNCLFFTTYALLQKLNLITNLGLDDTTVKNFLTAVQAGYHPNPYHNAVHAADVAQINYFITMRCGLSTLCALSQEEILASVLAGAIHDYDHPGLNNSFHYNTSAYLSTLYNDRSILENHHLACVYEILRHRKFNMFAKMSEDQCRIIRDTMTEMVLATDMGMHGKILSAFQRRIQEGALWAQKKEDALLALSMSIKMADIANCGRPTSLYVEWAKNIAAEFYGQGDEERKLKLPISPFMDRRKDKVDFPKGQTSFINFVVMPTFEAMGELLPSLSFTYNHCAENREYWVKRDQ